MRKKTLYAAAIFCFTNCTPISHPSWDSAKSESKDAAVRDLGVTDTGGFADSTLVRDAGEVDVLVAYDTGISDRRSPFDSARNDSRPTCPIGTSGCPCRSNGTCDSELICQAGICRSEEPMEIRVNLTRSVDLSSEGDGVGYACVGIVESCNPSARGSWRGGYEDVSDPEDSSQYRKIIYEDGYFFQAGSRYYAVAYFDEDDEVHECSSGPETGSLFSSTCPTFTFEPGTTIEVDCDLDDEY